MFKKVLVVEDLDSIGYGISHMLEKQLGVDEVVLSQYCSDAYLKFIHSERESIPFDLLITDLSFHKDHRDDKIANGKHLIKQIRALGYSTPIIVCSVEEKLTTIRNLFKQDGISGYIVKGRQGLRYLAKAIETIKKGSTYLSPQLSDLMHRKEVFEIKDYDIKLLYYLSKGQSQEEISRYLNQKGVSPNSLSSIEKRLNRLKDELKANSTIQLIANAKDIGLI